VLVLAGRLAIQQTDPLVALEEAPEKKTLLTHKAVLQIKDLFRMWVHTETAVDINSIGLDHKLVLAVVVLALPVVMYLIAHHLQIVDRVRVVPEYNLVPERLLILLQVAVVVHLEPPVRADQLAAAELVETRPQMVDLQRQILDLAVAELVLRQMVVQVVQG
jgi:hypothetical protein